MSRGDPRRAARHRELRYCTPCGLKWAAGTGTCQVCGSVLTARTSGWHNAADSKRIWQARERTAVRREAEEDPQEVGLFAVWTSIEPGHPLGGGGMPLGTTLRLDGESHSNAWRRILREDPCAYCGAPCSGTVDHVVPRSTGERYVERWPNLVGACEDCNRRKSSTPLLFYLLQHRQTARQMALIRANRPDRSRAEAVAIADAQRKRARRRKRELYLPPAA